MSASDSSPRDGPQQEVADRLVDPSPVGDEPEVDGAELADDLAADAGLLGDLADRGLLGGLTRFDVALGQRPQQPALPVGAADQGAARHVPIQIEDQAAGAELVDPTQPAPPAGGVRPFRPVPGPTCLGPWPDGNRRTRTGGYRWPPVTWIDGPPGAAPTRTCGGRPMTSPADLIAVPAEADRLGEAFAAAGHELHLVGGTVRDALLGRRSPDEPDTDLDFATDARPEQVLDLVARVAQATWTTGIEFGTVGARVADRACEITTYRADRYDRVTRKPEVVYGTSLRDDLLRRDFTVNAMALSVTDDRIFSDPFGGLADLARGVAAHACPAGGLLRRRSAADVARRPVRLHPRRYRRRRRARRHDRDGAGARPDHARSAYRWS